MPCSAAREPTHCIITIFLAGYARADKAQLQEKLSKSVQIQLSDVTIAEALEKIGEKSGDMFALACDGFGG